MYSTENNTYTAMNPWSTKYEKWAEGEFKTSPRVPGFKAGWNMVPNSLKRGIQKRNEEGLSLDSHV